MQVETCIVIPVHNRRETTLACLRRLSSLQVFDWAHVVVVDDGSSDGTAEAVRSKFPAGVVTVLDGDGTLWWAGGINLGMRFACEQGAQFVVWLNDDCLPVGDALRQLRDCSVEHGAISVGQAQCPSGSLYGGHRKTALGLRLMTCDRAEGELPCDTFAGNAVCVPRAVIEAVGYLDADRMPMTYADVDYGLRARDAGFHASIVAEARFENADNLGHDYQSWLLGNYRTADMWRSFSSVKSPLSFGPRFCFFRKHWGPWGYVLSGQAYLRFILIAAIRVVVPVRYLRRFYGCRSKTWKKFEFYEEDGC